MGTLLHLFGGRIAHKAIANQMNGSPLDVKVGFKMLKDRRVPLRSKMLALGIGCAIVAALIALELPIESIVSALAFGLIPSVLLDGLEAIVGPVLFGCLLLPFFAPRQITQQIRLDRAGLTDGPVIDIESSAPVAPNSLRGAH